jgi:hypothetical protein
MMNNKLTNFILTGSIENLSIGQSVDISRGKWISSVEEYANGIPKLCQCSLDELVINVGITEENKIEYMVVHMKDLDANARLHIGNLSNPVSIMTMDELLIFFNEAKIEWRFKTIFEKVVILFVEETNIEIIFSYYPDEGIGLQTIQIDGRMKVN